MTYAFLIAGGAFVILGALSLFNVRRRKFNRRNQLGVETFRSYSHMAVTRSVDVALSAFSWCLLLAGAACVVKWALAGVL